MLPILQNYILLLLQNYILFLLLGEDAKKKPRGNQIFYPLPPDLYVSGSVTLSVSRSVGWSVGPKSNKKIKFKFLSFGNWQRPGGSRGHQSDDEVEDKEDEEEVKDDKDDNEEAKEDDKEEDDDNYQTIKCRNHKLKLNWMMMKMKMRTMKLTQFCHETQFSQEQGGRGGQQGGGRG